MRLYVYWQGNCAAVWRTRPVHHIDSDVLPSDAHQVSKRITKESLSASVREFRRQSRSIVHTQLYNRFQSKHKTVCDMQVHLDKRRARDGSRGGYWQLPGAHRTQRATRHMSRAPWSEVLGVERGHGSFLQACASYCKAESRYQARSKTAQQCAADRDAYARASRAWSPPTDRKRAL